MVSTTDFDSVSLGSSPSSPTKLTNMEEIEKLMLEFAKFNIKPSDVLGKTVIFECKSISAYE